MKHIIAVTLLWLFCCLGCARNQPKTVTIPKPVESVTIETPTPQSPGSIWVGDRYSLFGDIKANKVGDIVTVVISEEASASKEASTQSGRTTSMGAQIPNFFGLEKAAFFSKNPDIDLANLVKADFKNNFQGSGKTTRKENLVATLTTQVVEVYPNGNLKIRGGKSVMVNSEDQLIYLTGIVRPQDITARNIVDSKYILNAQIAYTGQGALSDKQTPGWMMRILDNVWPF